MAVAGKGGSVKVGGTNTVAELENWKLDISADALDTTNFGSNGWKQFIAGLKEWAGSAEGTWNMGDTNGQKGLQDALLGGTTVTIELNVNGTNKYSGTAYIKKIGVETPVGGTVKVSFEFQGSGALTYA